MILSGNHYLNQYALFPAFIQEQPARHLNLSVVIPCSNEDHLLKTLQSLRDSNPPANPAEVLIVINSADNAPAGVIEQNKRTMSEALEWIQGNSNEHLKFFLLPVQFNHRHAGVGLARKTGMDEAVRRFEQVHNWNGIIACLDADCTVSNNYLVELETHFLTNPKSTGCSIRFEHPVEGIEYDTSVYHAIIDYELYLYLYHSGLEYSGFPYCFQTVGSCMAVRNSVYQKSGGMNRRKAGEDFYFLHKIFPLGNFHSLNSACVCPSPRSSLRVPFGTGSIINKVLFHNHKITAFNPQSFEDFKTFNQQVTELFDTVSFSDWVHTQPVTIQSFLDLYNSAEKILEIKCNSASVSSFKKRFYSWFNGLMTLQYFHFCRDHFYADIGLSEATQYLFQKAGLNTTGLSSHKEMLFCFRRLSSKGVLVTFSLIFTSLQQMMS